MPVRVRQRAPEIKGLKAGGHFSDRQSLYTYQAIEEIAEREPLCGPRNQSKRAVPTRCPFFLAAKNRACEQTGPLLDYGPIL